MPGQSWDNPVRLLFKRFLVYFSPLIVSCHSVAIRMQIRIVRCERPAKRQNTNPAKERPVSFLHFGSQESVLKVPKRGQVHAATCVTPKRCDSCAQGALAYPLKAIFSLKGYFYFLRLFLRIAREMPFKTRFKITF